VASANAFTVGPSGTTNPTFNVDTSVSSAATGLNIQGQAAGSGLVITVISSGTNEGMSLTTKGTGQLNLQGASNPGLAVAGVASAATGLLVTPAAAASGVTLAVISSGTNESGTINAKGTGSINIQGAANPALQVAGVASAATGWLVTPAAAASGVKLAVISSGTNESGSIDAKGSGTVNIGANSTGGVKLGAGVTGGPAVIIPGTLTAGGLLTAAIQIATSGPLIYSGSGAPSISAAVQGSLYLRSDGSSTSTRLYVATNTSGTWTNVTTAA
jgi:hypothetical protein